MKNDSMQKVKLLRISEILMRETDEEHPISHRQLCERIHQLGIAADVRTITRYIQALAQFV